jgi:hypothetical protein
MSADVKAKVDARMAEYGIDLQNAVASGSKTNGASHGTNASNAGNAGRALDSIMTAAREFLGK